VGVGLVLYLVLSFVYYASLDIAVPVPRAAIMPTAAVLVGACWVYAAARQRGGARPPETDKTGLVAVDALLLLSFVGWVVAGPEPEAVAPAGFPVRVMTYNIHSAYNSQGRQDPEAIAQVIEESGADIVALQEVSRGWLIDGATDLPGWLSRRLGLPYIFRGTADLVWGNAILSRYPIVDHGWGRLPLVGTLLPRGYVWAEIEVGGQEPLLVIATHLHHVEGEHEPRLAQVPVLLEFWGARPTSVLLGDLNSQPGFPEMDLIAQAGFVDSWVEAGDGDGYSWPAVGAWERIDWIWHTPDLVARQAVATDTAASDHLPVLVTLETAP
jgi:endonuclease/exonuclease/phosphatase family metal-dependent hydrolase